MSPRAAEQSAPGPLLLVHARQGRLWRCARAWPRSQAHVTTGCWHHGGLQVRRGLRGRLGIAHRRRGGRNTWRLLARHGRRLWDAEVAALLVWASALCRTLCLLGEKSSTKPFWRVSSPPSPSGHSMTELVPIAGNALKKINRRWDVHLHTPSRLAGPTARSCRACVCYVAARRELVRALRGPGNAPFQKVVELCCV